jgi:hypothetical protein
MSSTGAQPTQGAGTASTTALSQVVTINGIKVKVSATKKAVTLESNVLYPKDKRDVLSPEKLNELFERAISKSFPNVY